MWKPANSDIMKSQTPEIQEIEKCKIETYEKSKERTVNPKT